jgi:hypothetical protein
MYWASLFYIVGSEEMGGGGGDFHFNLYTHTWGWKE